MSRQVQCTITEVAPAGTAATFHRLPPLAGAALRRADTTRPRRGSERRCQSSRVIAAAPPTSPSLRAQVHRLQEMLCSVSSPTARFLVFFIWKNKAWKMLNKLCINTKIKEVSYKILRVIQLSMFWKDLSLISYRLAGNFVEQTKNNFAFVLSLFLAYS